MNKACLFKPGWKLFAGSNDLWCQILCGKYGDDNLRGDINIRASNSPLWQSICKLHPHITGYGVWSIGDSSNDAA
jgi:hypothetical protein